MPCSILNSFFLRRFLPRGFVACVLLLFAVGVHAADDAQFFTLYHDADWSNSAVSSESIWLGVQTALHEIDFKVQGYQLQLIKKNHSGNVLRSRNNILDFIDDDSALALISGIHSPPLIKNQQLIHDNGVLTLVPWAAGSSITRYPSSKNWIFRLSVDDRKAGDFLVSFAVDTKKCKSPHLLLENTLWGDSNVKSMSKALVDKGFQLPAITRFDWTVKSHQAMQILKDINHSQSDCILFVGNAKEGAEIARAMAKRSQKQRVPLISHWGITSGDFNLDVPWNIRKKIDLTFIQTCFSFLQQPLSPKSQQVLHNAQRFFPQKIKSAEDIRSPVGFIHGYDLTSLLIAAMNTVNFVDDIAENRMRVRAALESLPVPVQGLLKMYKKPFSVFSQDNIDAHEALNSKDYCMATYNRDNTIGLLAD